MKNLRVPPENKIKEIININKKIKKAHQFQNQEVYQDRDQDQDRLIINQKEDQMKEKIIIIINTKIMINQKNNIRSINIIIKIKINNFKMVHLTQINIIIMIIIIIISGLINKIEKQIHKTHTIIKKCIINQENRNKIKRLNLSLLKEMKIENLKLIVINF